MQKVHDLRYVRTPHNERGNSIHENFNYIFDNKIWQEKFQQINDHLLSLPTFPCQTFLLYGAFVITTLPAL